MSTNQLSLARARANIGLVPLILAAAQTILLYLTTSSLLVLNTIYGCSSLCGTGGQRLVPLIAAVFGVAMFALPSVIGAFSRSWRSALVLATLPWWIAVIAHAGTLLSPYIGLGGQCAGWPLRRAVLAEREPSAAAAGLAGALRRAGHPRLAGAPCVYGRVVAYITHIW